MSNVPMSDEQRAALEQRLAQLRATQAAANSQGDLSATPFSGAAPRPERPTPSQQQAAPYMGYAYDDDNEVEEEDEEDSARQQFEDEFLQLLARQQGQTQSHQQQQQTKMQELNAASVAAVSATTHANEGIDVVPTDKTAQRSRELGDFEVLRLAKMGDIDSMRNFGRACSIAWKTFVDNHGRNVLHYAADARSAALIRIAAEELRVPYVADEKHLTPLDIAILNGCTCIEGDEVSAALISAAKAAGHSDGSLNAAEGTMKMREDLLLAHAPAPPKFVLSKPVAKAITATKPRSFWSTTAAPSSKGGEVGAVRCSSGTDLSEKERARLSEGVSSLVHHGRFEWMLPLTRGTPAPCADWQVAQTLTSDGATVNGMAAARFFLNASLKGEAAKKVATEAKVVVAAHLAVRGDLQSKGTAASLLHGLRSHIEDAVGQSGSPIVFFASGMQLPRPPAALATIKWYRRVFDAAKIFASDSAYDVFPDFYKYDEVLRADAVLKGTLPASLEKQYASDLPLWCDVDRESDEQCRFVLAFLQAKAGAPESNVELVCVPDDVQELRRMLLVHPDHRAYIRMSSEGSVTDLVVFRVCDARKAASPKTPSSSTTAHRAGVFATEVVFALFTSLSGTTKVDHLMLLSSKLLSTTMLLIPTMFGITDSELAKSNFDELLPCREYLYAVSASTRKEVDGLAPLSASKTALPICTF